MLPEAKSTIIFIKSFKSQGKQIYSPILTTRAGTHTGAEGLGQELGGEPREVGAYQDEMKQVAGIAMIKTGCSCLSLLRGRLMKCACQAGLKGHGWL